MNGEIVNITCDCGHSWVRHQHPEADYYCDVAGCDCGAYTQPVNSHKEGK
jgi:hypothetical protein